ncbi:sialin-like [Zophobas morio]|uniref:sialin-like n=1 Tax=Zophobas morio TaxID=2755281 RepID=UPI0030827852
MSTEHLTCQRVLSITVLLGFMIHHMLRVNISIAIVEMIFRNTSNTTQENYGPRYNWDEKQKNDIFGYFFWGYIITQIPGGRLSEKLGAKIVVGTGLLAASLLTLLTPVAAHLGHFCLVVDRFCLGIALGIHWPSTPPIATKWIPPADRATFMSHMAASSLGVAITLPVCGYLITYWGWASVFYVTGSISLTWSLCWFYLIYDSPEEHPRITSSEKDKLRKDIKPVNTSLRKPPIPWTKLLTSGPVWSVIMGNTCAGCTFFVAFNQLPTYMSQVLHFNIKTNGWFSSLPYLVRYLVSVLTSVAADKLKRTDKFSTTTIRKFFNVAFFAGAGCLFTVQAFWGYSGVVSVAVFTGSLGLLGLVTAGFHTNPLDIAPAFAGTIFGVSQVPMSLVGYATTEVVAFFTKKKQGFEQWAYVFWMLVGVNIFAAVFSLVFTSGEEQSWSVDADAKEREKLEGNELSNKV